MNCVSLAKTLASHLPKGENKWSWRVNSVCTQSGDGDPLTLAKIRSKSMTHMTLGYPGEHQTNPNSMECSLFFVRLFVMFGNHICMCVWNHSEPISTHSNNQQAHHPHPQPSKEREVAGGANGQWTDDGVRSQALVAIRVPMNRDGAITSQELGYVLVINHGISIMVTNNVY